MDLYLIRHGESTANRDHMYAAWLPMPLTEAGIEQAKAVGNYLKNVSFDRFYCSDVYRTVQTFDYAFGAEHPREYSALLREANSGDLAGKTYADCAAEYGELHGRIRTTWEFNLVGGESGDQVIVRAAAFLKEMEALPEDVKRVAAVSHGGLIRAMAAHLVHQPLGSFPMAMSNCGVSVLRYDRKKGVWNIVHWNIGCQLGDGNATDGIGK